MKAFILAKVPARRSGGLVSRLKGQDGVSHAYVLFGDWDLLVECDVLDVKQLDHLVFDLIQSDDNVEVTRTYIISEALSF